MRFVGLERPSEELQLCLRTLGQMTKYQNGESERLKRGSEIRVSIFGRLDLFGLVNKVKHSVSVRG